MKKLALTSLLAISIAAPAFGAVGDKTINAGASSAPCTSATLDTPTGPAALEADWDANTITINWNAKNGTTINPTQCVYDDTLNLPATPSKTGYTFGGWTVAVSGGTPTPQQQNCFANLSSVMDDDLSFGGSGGTLGQNATWWADLADGHYENISVDEDMPVRDTVYGRVTGISKCSSTPRSAGNTGTPSDENGGYCWCQATTYTPNGGAACSVASPVWVAVDPLDDSDGCAYACAGVCSDFVLGDSFTRAVLFGQSN